MFSIARTGVGSRKIIARLMKLLTRRSVLVEGDEGSGYLADGDADSNDARTHARSGRCRPRPAAIELPSVRAPARRSSRCKVPCRETPRWCQGTVAAAHANDCFKAFHRGRATSGLGRRPVPGYRA